VLVIGLGPAGGTAACVAARAGLAVIAVDRKAEIGLPVQCAEFIPAPLGCHAQAPGVLRQRIDAMHSRLPSGAMSQTAFTGLMVDRAAFDAALAGRAADAGARLSSGTALDALLPQGRARLRRDDEAFEVTYRLLIAADGPASRVARCLGLPALKTVHTRQHTVPLLRPAVHTDIWLSPDYPGGYAWLFPKGDRANLGLGLDRRFAGDMKGPLDRLHAQLTAQGIVGRDILQRTGGLIPVGGLRERLVHGETLFVGDAAGLTHPITGAGIAAAVLSGERAGQACADFLGGASGALAEFEEDLRDQFGESIARALRAREEMEQLWLTPAAHGDPMHRRGWIAFDEYYAS
jgi:geranylgeranyl reductase family protein